MGKIRLYTSSTMIGVILAIIGVVMFSAKAVLVKMVYVYGVSPIVTLMLRMLFALPIYVVILIYVQRKKKASISFKQVVMILILGVLGYYFASYLDFLGLKFITASLERLILFVYPTMVVVIVAISKRKMVPLKHIVAILITYSGVFLAFYKNVELQQQPRAWLGVSLIFICALAYALYLFGSNKVILQIGPVRFTCIAMITACIASIVHYGVSNNQQNLIGYPIQVYILELIMSVVSTILPSFFISEALKKLGASKVAIIGSLGPISTIILASLFIGEKIGFYQMLGTIVVIIGVLVVNVERSHFIPKLRLKANKKWQL